MAPHLVGGKQCDVGSDDWVLALVAGRVRETSGEPIIVEI
jgi:hypothetical protein